MFRNRFSAFLTFAAASLFVVILLYMLSSTVSSRKRSRLLGAWAGSLGTLEEIVAAHPSRDANDSALVLEGLVAELGIGLVPRWREEEPRTPRIGPNAHDEIRGPLGKYVEREIVRTDAGVDPPPEVVAEYLLNRTEALDAVRAHLLSAPAPRWGLKTEELVNTTFPNLMGQVHLVKLLLADALARSAVGDRDGALDSAEACWRLMTSLRDDPFLITQLSAISNTRRVAGTLRRLHPTSPEWRERLVSRDYRRPLLRALQLESWIWIQLDDELMMRSGNALQKAVVSLTKPYVSYCASDLSEDFRRRLVALDSREFLCDESSDLSIPAPWWNFIGRVALPDFGDVADRLGRLEVDLELTAKLLEIHAAREGNGGNWAPALPGVERSAACPRDRWIYDVGADGTMNIALDRSLAWTNPKGVVLPTQYRSAPAPSSNLSP